MVVICETCFSPVDEERVDEVGMVQCRCGVKIAKDAEQQLTLVDDEMPDREYLAA